MGGKAGRPGRSGKAKADLAALRKRCRRLREALRETGKLIREHLDRLGRG